jgi:hypothetical protein
MAGKSCHRGFPGWSVLGGRARASGLSRKNSKRLHLTFHPTSLEASGQERRRSSRVERRRVASEAAPKGTRLIQRAEKENALTRCHPSISVHCASAGGAAVTAFSGSSIHRQPRSGIICRDRVMSALPPIVLQNSTRSSDLTIIESRRNTFLNQYCALPPDLESMLLTLARKIVLQHNRRANGHWPVPHGSPHTVHTLCRDQSATGSMHSSVSFLTLLTARLTA